VSECAICGRELHTDTLRALKLVQPHALETLRANGVVFDERPRKDFDPDDWQQIAFWLYTSLCEVDLLVRGALG